MAFDPVYWSYPDPKYGLPSWRLNGSLLAAPSGLGNPPSATLGMLTTPEVQIVNAPVNVLSLLSVNVEGADDAPRRIGHGRQPLGEQHPRFRLDRSHELRHQVIEQRDLIVGIVGRIGNEDIRDLAQHLAAPR